MSKHRKLVTIIKRSCLTGKVVWIYRGASRNAGRLAYWRACKKELEKVKQWAERMADRKRRLTLMLGSSVRMSKQEPPPDLEFYNHIVEERRRRQQDKDIRRKMREREQKATEESKDSTTGEIYDNPCYDK